MRITTPSWKEQLILWNKSPSLLYLLAGFLFVLAIIFLFLAIYFKTNGDFNTASSIFALLSSGILTFRTLIYQKSLFQMPSDEILAFIIKTDPKEDWQWVDTEGATEYFYKGNPSLRIRAFKSESHFFVYDFQAAWLKRVIDPVYFIKPKEHLASSSNYEIYFNGEKIENVVLVDLWKNNGPNNLPCPLEETMEAPKIADIICRIIAS